MSSKTKHAAICLALVVAFTTLTAEAKAQYVTYGYHTAAYYPAYHTTYRPVVYQTYRPYTSSYYSGWYPGYWLDRVNRSIWGQPVTTLTGYRAYSVGYTPTTTYYAPASGCSTCAVPTTTLRQVVLRPVCTTACSPCSPCATGCSTCSTVSQAVYESPTGCSSCGVSSGAPASPTPASPTPAYDPRPAIAPTESTPQERTFSKPELGAEDGQPSDVNNGSKEDNSTYFQAPKLFNPKDRTASQIAVPIWTAVYKKPASSRTAAIPISTPLSPHQQSQLDATGWMSTSQ